MFKSNSFFNNNSFNLNKFNKNIKKTKKVLNNLTAEINNFEIPVLESYMKNYFFDFSSKTINKFSKYKNIIIIGMGGSILGTKAIYSFFREKIKKKLFFFDNLDENLISEFKKIKNINNSCFIVVSKSGNTLETLTNFNVIFSKSYFKNKLIIISEIKDNSLLKIASEFKAEIIEHKDFIGGRYSVLSEVGMVPSALMKLKINKFHNLEKLLKNKKFISLLIKDVAVIYTLMSKGIRNSVILNYDSRLNDLCFWYQQLTAESLGKKGKGINPMISFAPKDHHSLLQLYLDGPKDKFFTFFNTKKNTKKYKISKSFNINGKKLLKNKNLNFVVNSQSQATKNIFKLKNIPYREIVFIKNNEEELGAIFTFLVLETILLARLLNVDPFNQSAVEQVKIETNKILLR
tara:strand:+ start:119 stop:1330 length:1212 start_codon:yes stop_codon:yes gene_type:complete